MESKFKRIVMLIGLEDDNNMAMSGKKGRQFTVYLKPHKVATDKLIVDWLENDEDPEATVSRKMAAALRYYYENVIQRNDNSVVTVALEELFENLRFDIARDTRTILGNYNPSLHEGNGNDNNDTTDDDEFSEETAFLATLAFG